MSPQGLVITPIEFARDEWDLLVRGWTGLSPDEKERRVSERVAQLRAEGKLPALPALPGWDDIIRLGPLGPKQTADELRARRRAIAVRIRQSPTPPEVRALGSVVNAIDDAEDILSLVSLIGRLVVRAAPRVLGRLIPGLRVLVTASDVLNLLTFLTQAVAIGAGFKHAGLTGAAATAAGPVVAKAVLKNELWELLRIAGRKRVAAGSIGKTIEKIFDVTRLPTFHKLTKAEILANRVVTLGAILEAGQATETITGVGLSLGALMGYLQDTAWGFHQAAFGRIPPGADVLAKELREDIPTENIVFLDSIPNRTRY